MASLLLLAFGGLFILIGFGTIKYGFDRRQQANLVEETPTEDVESLSMGQSEIKGTAKPTDEGTITAPFTDDECLVAAWEVEEFVVRHDHDGSDTRRWTTEGVGLESVPFYVDDGTGQALVRPSTEATYDIDTEAEEPIVVPDGGDPPERVEKFLEREDWEGHTVEGASWTNWSEASRDYSDGDRRYSQYLIELEEDVYVFGVAQPRDDVRAADNPANVVIEKMPEEDADLEDMFMISDLDEEEIVENRSGAMWYLPLGAVLATIGFGMLLWGAGLF